MEALTKVSAWTLGLLGLTLVVFTQLTFDQVRSLLDLTAADGNAEQFTNEIYSRTKTLIGFYGFGFILLAAAVVYFRSRSKTSSLTDLRATSIQKWRLFTSQTTTSEWVLIVCILTLGFIVRWVSLDLPIHSDEAWTYLNYVSRNPIHIMAEYRSPNNHILHNLFAWLTTTAMGDTVVALRIPAFLAGLICLPLTYWLALKLGNRHSALLAMAMVAVWPMLVDYSANARGYSMINAGTLALFICAHAIRQNDSSVGYGLFAVISAFGLYTIPSFAISIIAAGLWILFGNLMRRDLQKFSLTITRLAATAAFAIFLVIVLYAPAITVNGIEAILNNDVVTGNEASLIQLAERFSAVWQDWHQGTPWIIKFAIAGLFVVAFFLRRDQIGSMWLALLCAAVCILVIQGTVGPSRIWIFALPLLLTVSAIAMTQLWQPRWQRPISYGSCIAVMLVFATLYAQQPGHALYKEAGDIASARTITKHIATQLQSNDGLATIFPANRTINWYAKQLGVDKKISDARKRLRDNSFERLLVVMPSGKALTDVLEFNDQQNATRNSDRVFNVLKTIEEDGTTLAIVMFKANPIRPNAR